MTMTFSDLGRIVGLFAIFWFMQCGGLWCFTWSGRQPTGWRETAFAGGAVLILGSMPILNLIYREVPVPVAYGIAIGVAFVAAQVMLSWCFGPQLTVGQWTGALVIAIGVAMMSLLGR